MRKSRKLINLLGCMALVLFLPACGGNPGTADLSQGDASAPADGSSASSEGASCSLPYGGILSYQTEEKTVALICLDRDGARDFITLTFYQQPTVSQLLERIFEDDVSWKEKNDMPQDFLSARYNTEISTEEMAATNGYIQMEISQDISGDQPGKPVISMSGWEDHTECTLPAEAKDVVCWISDPPPEDPRLSSGDASSSEPKPTLTREEADAEIQRRLAEQLDEITPQLEAQGAMDQLPVYQEIFQAEAEYEVYQEFDVVE